MRMKGSRLIGMNETIAVIGSGMAGLAAARMFKDAGKTVTVFEAQPRQGMNAHTVPFHQGMVDVPLRVMSPQAWRSVLALAAQVGVTTFEVNTYTSCSWLDQETWFRSSRIPLTQWPTVGSWRYLNGKSLRIAHGFIQLSRAIRELKKQGDSETTLGVFLQTHGFDALFWRGLVLPVLTTICTCSEESLLAWPALDLLTLLETIVHGDTLLRLQGGTTALVNALAADLDFRSGSPVAVVTQDEAGVLVKNQRGEGGRFSRVIVATQANQLDFLDPRQFAHEVAALQAIRFDQGELVVHSDPRFMPRRRSEWTALNYLMSKDLQASMFTVWVNAVEPTIAQAPPVFQTWNPLFAPAPEHTIARVPLARAVVHSGTQRALAELKRMHAEPSRRVFFCGSWAYPGVPLLESAVRSAMAVADSLQVPVAWAAGR